MTTDPYRATPAAAHRRSYLKIHRYMVLVLVTGSLLSCTTTNVPDLAGMSFSDEPLIGKAVWHDLVTDNPAAAQKFYEEPFGWTFRTGLLSG